MSKWDWMTDREFARAQVIAAYHPDFEDDDVVTTIRRLKKRGVMA